MSQLTLDARIKFGQTISLPGPTAIVTAAIVGGPIARLQVAIFDANDSIIDGVGFGTMGASPSSAANGTASWLFVPDPNAAYMKWGLTAVRSAAGLGAYSVTVKVRDANGNPLAVSQFSGQIPDGSLNDDVVTDGVKLAQVTAQVPLAGAVV